MAKLAKLLSSASGSPSGLDVDEVFSNYVYEGQGAFSAVNGLDMASNGGLVWIKNRDNVKDHRLFSTGLTDLGYYLSSSTTGSETDLSTQGITSFNSDGWSVGTGNSETNAAGWGDYVSYSFMKSSKFFDIQTWSGDDTTGRVISHNLGCQAGLVVIKDIDGGGTDWIIAHHDEPTKVGYFTPTSFFVAGYINTLTSSFTLGDTVVNSTGRDYVAYIFAHNNSDGEFGPDADQDIIKCGTYTGAGTSGPTVNLGFEPQWLLIKAAGATGDWYIFDTMRGLTPSTEGYNDRAVYANLNNNEEARNYVNINQTGFKIVSSVISSGGTQYLYMAIRNGPLKEPTSASNVFAIDTFGGTGGGVAPAFRSTFPVDMALRKTIIGSNENWELSQRQIQGTSLRPNDINVLDQGVGAALFDYMNGWNTGTSVNSDVYSWMWKRAPGYFDALYYSGNNNNGRNITHNLGVVPEMIWVKAVDSGDNWMVGTQSEGDAYTKLNDYDGFTSSTTRLRMTGNTDTTFQVGNDSAVNSSSFNYVAYLFASKAGISKVGTYTGNGTSQNIECGFSNGAKLIIIKSTGAASANWVLIDSQRGLSNEVYINLPSAQGTSSNVTSYSGGFALNNTNSANKNANGTTYIFYAIAAP